MSASTQKQAFFDLLATLNEDPGKQTSKWSEKEMAFFSSLKSSSASTSQSSGPPASSGPPTTPRRPGAAAVAAAASPRALPTAPRRPSVPPPALPSSGTAHTSPDEEGADSKSAFYNFLLSFAEENDEPTQREAEFFARMQQSVGIEYSENMPPDLRRDRRREIVTVFIENKDLSKGANADALFELLSSRDASASESQRSSAGPSSRGAAPAPPRRRRAFPVAPAPSRPGEQYEQGEDDATAYDEQYDNEFDEQDEPSGDGELPDYSAPCPPAPSAAAVAAVSSSASSASSSSSRPTSGMAAAAGRRAPPPRPNRQPGLASTVGRRGGGALAVLQKEQRPNYRMSRIWLADVAAAIDMVDQEKSDETLAEEQHTGGKTTEENVQWAIALFNYEKLRDDELSFRCNNIVEVLSTQTKSKGWWLVRRLDQQGICPSNYLKVIEKPQGPIGKILYDYNAEERGNQYLSLKAGEDIVVLKQDSSGWWTGYFNFHQGLFPGNYVQLPDAAESSSVSAASSSTAAASSSSTSRGSSGKKSVEDLVKLLMDPSCTLVTALGRAVDAASQEKLARELVYLWAARDDPLNLMHTCMNFEVGYTTKENTLFRVNSLASYQMKAYTKMMGRQFVQDILFPVIEDLCKAVQGRQFFEVAASKLEPKKGSIKRNQKNVLAHSQFFFDRITASYKKVPGSLRKVSELLVKAISQKFPDSKYIVIGGFYFLRYLCPAIISPEGHGYKSSIPLDSDCRRGLVLVSKVIQQISNGVEFGAKEEFMKPFNNYVRDSIGRVRNYFDQISDVVAGTPIEACPPVPEDQLELIINELHSCVAMHMDKLKSVFEQAGSIPQEYYDLEEILAAIPPPTEASKEKRIEALVKGKSDSEIGLLKERAIAKSMEGFLLRKGKGAMNKDKLCFFVVRPKDPTLYQYPDKLKEKCEEKTIDLRKVVSVTPASFDISDNPNFEFIVKRSKGASIPLRAGDEKNMWQWIHAINEARS
mmetsp:Transcript_6968/g.17607  ORF Transcript_6968/g.17607 Transcript_6968/m.17607 type:complete len:987 (-) Transcript_6968:37-2997(-)